MTPLPQSPAAAPAAPVLTPALTPSVPPRPTAPAGQLAPFPSFEAVRERIVATVLKTDDAQRSTDDLARPDAPLFPALADPATLGLPAALPQLPTIATPPAFAETTTIKPQTTGKISAATAPSIFFQDEDATAPDATAFAEDLIAALTATATSAVVADTRTPTTIDAPVAADPLPKLDMTSDVWLDQLSRDIAATASADGKLSFRIVPPQLGKLDISIETRDAGVAVHMKAETREAHAIIANAQPRLEDALGAQGIRVAETGVTSNGGGDLPRPQFVPQKPLIESVTETEHESDAPTSGRDAGRFA